ncbi:MAG: GNAT family N-acetyltransferase [Cellvibrionaceae bacterium]
MLKSTLLTHVELPGGLWLRPLQPADEALAKELFRSTREHFYQPTIPRHIIDTLMNQQYQLQQTAYARQWPRACTLIVQQSTDAIGKIIADETKTTLHLIDFALTPAVRRKGHGTSILRALQTYAQKRRLQVRLSVDHQNLPAKKLYRALGFQVSGTNDTHEAMIWSPTVPAFDTEDKSRPDHEEKARFPTPLQNEQHSRSTDNG